MSEVAAGRMVSYKAKFNTFLPYSAVEDKYKGSIPPHRSGGSGIN